MQLTASCLPVKRRLSNSWCQAPGLGCHFGDGERSVGGGGNWRIQQLVTAIIALRTNHENLSQLQQEKCSHRQILWRLRKLSWKRFECRTYCSIGNGIDRTFTAVIALGHAGGDFFQKHAHSGANRTDCNCRRKSALHTIGSKLMYFFGGRCISFALIGLDRFFYRVPV